MNVLLQFASSIKLLNSNCHQIPASPWVFVCLIFISCSVLFCSVPPCVLLPSPGWFGHLELTSQRQRRRRKKAAPFLSQESPVSAFVAPAPGFDHQHGISPVSFRASPDAEPIHDSLHFPGASTEDQPPASYTESPDPVDHFWPVPLCSTREIAESGDHSESPLRSGSGLLGELVERVLPGQEFGNLLWGQKLILSYTGTGIGFLRKPSELKRQLGPRCSVVGLLLGCTPAVLPCSSGFPPLMGLRNGIQDPTLLDTFRSQGFRSAFRDSHPWVLSGNRISVM